MHNSCNTGEALQLQGTTDMVICAPTASTGYRRPESAGTGL